MDSDGPSLHPTSMMPFSVFRYIVSIFSFGELYDWCFHKVTRIEIPTYNKKCSIYSHENLNFSSLRNVMW